MRISVQMFGLLAWVVMRCLPSPSVLHLVFGLLSVLTHSWQLPCCALFISQRLVGHTLEGTGPGQTTYGTLEDLSLGRSLGYRLGAEAS